MKKTDGKSAAGYAAQYEELQRILAALEGGEIDVDELSAKVKRAAELIESCQQRLKEAEGEVKRVVDKFEKQLPVAEEDEEDGAGEGDDASSKGGGKGRGQTEIPF